MKLFGIILAALAVFCGGARAGDPPPAQAFAKLPAVFAARLSPDGKRVALTSGFQGRQVLYVHSLEEGGKDSKIVRFEDFSIYWVRWQDNEHLVAGLRKSENPFFSATPTESYINKLMSVDADSNEVKLIGAPERARSAPDRLVTVTRSVATGSGGQFEERDTTVLGKASPDESWREIRRLKPGSDEIFTALAFLPDNPKILYVLSNRGLDGKAGLWSFDITTNRFVELIDGEAALGAGTQVENGELLGYQRRDGAHVYLDPAWQADYQMVNKAMNGAEVTIVDRAADGSHVLLEAHKPHQPKVWWVLDRTVKPLNLWPAVEQYPGMPAEKLALVTEVSYTARDGLVIPAYLTLPAAYKDGPIPFVVIPHDGPNTCVEREFDYVSQFLASRGWGVLRPSYRGSACHGPAIEHASYEDWPGAIQDEIADGAHWLIGQHYADAARICIVGDGFGGYSALQGVIREPDLYRCAAAWAPFTDFVDRHGRNDDVRQRTSPVQRAGSIKVPVLLMHGKEDAVINVHQSELMEEALHGWHKPVEVLYLDKADHYRLDEDSRTAWLSALDKFLGVQLGRP